MDAVRKGARMLLGATLGGAAVGICLLAVAGVCVMVFAGVDAEQIISDPGAGLWVYIKVIGTVFALGGSVLMLGIGLGYGSRLCLRPFFTKQEQEVRS